MPTLSQWKILRSLMLLRRKAEEDLPQEALEAGEAAYSTDGENEETTDSRRAVPISYTEVAISSNCEYYECGDESKDGFDNHFPDIRKERSNTCRPTSSRDKGGDRAFMSPIIRGESNLISAQSEEIKFRNSPRLRSAKRRSAVDISKLPEVAEHEYHHGTDGTRETLLSQRNANTDVNNSSDYQGVSSDNLLDVEISNTDGRCSREELMPTPSTMSCSSVKNFPDLLDPVKLRWRRLSLKSARSLRQSPVPAGQADVKANKSVKFSGYASVGHLDTGDTDTIGSESEDEDKLPINFDDIERRFNDNLSIKLRRPQSCNLSDRNSKRSLESLITVSSLQPLGSAGAPPSQRSSNSERLRRSVQLQRRNTSPYLFHKLRQENKLTVEPNTGGRNKSQEERVLSLTEKWKIKDPGYYNNSPLESSAVRNGKACQPQTGIPDQRLTSARVSSPVLRGRDLKRDRSRLSLPGYDLSPDAAPESTLIVRGGPQASQTTDNWLTIKKSLNRTSSVRNGFHEVSRWSMATQSIVTEQCASLGHGSRPSSGILNPQPTVVNDIDMPEEVQNNLQKLGFRKRDKSKKKKSDKAKKSSQKKSSGKADNQRSAIDLKKDPLLLKVQKKNRNVGKFTCAPDPMPNAVCFEIADTNLCHSDVLRLMKPLTDAFPEVKIRSIQFVYRSLVNSIPDMDNRWIINTNSVMSRNRLAGSDITVKGQTMQLRRYDDVITSEYNQYTRMMDFVKMMNSRKII